MRDGAVQPFGRATVITATILLVTVGVPAVAFGQLGAGVAAQERGTTWLEWHDNPVYDPSDGRAYYPTVIHDDGTYKMWHSGTSEGGFGIEMATSQDGIEWSEPEDASDGLASFSHHAHVEKIEDHYRIWYWDCCSRDDISVLRTATSTDGVTWEDDEPLQQVDGDVITGEPGSVWNRFGLGLEDVIYNPDGADTIVTPDDPESVFENRFVGYIGTSNGGQQFVGLAVSADGVTWEAYQDGAAPVFGPSGDGWDATHVYPGSVFRALDGFHMVYSGGDGEVDQGIGYAYSANGVDWERADDPIFHVDDGEAWRSEETYTPTVLPSTGQMWFTGEAEGGSNTIGYAQGLPQATLACKILCPSPPGLPLDG